MWLLHKKKRKNLLPIPCHSPKSESPKHILLGAIKLNGADVKNETFLDTTSLFRRPPGSPILSSKPRLGRCQKDNHLPLDFLPLQIQIGQRRGTCLKSKRQISVKCTNVSLTAGPATVNLQNKGERQFCVPVWSHSSRNSTIPAKTSS